MLPSPLPTGTVTFLFTDIEDSTLLWEKHPEAMKFALAIHDSILKVAVESNHGQIVKTTGDGIYAVFAAALDSTKAALDAQRAFHKPENFKTPEITLRVRMGLHSGEAELRDGDYHGSSVNLAARVMGLGHGGQILLSEITAALIKANLPVGCSLTDLDEHRLKGIAAPERIFQLCHPELTAEFPPLKSLAVYKHNLHPQLSTFIGREKELAAVKRLLGDTRLLTLLGPGGTGKTRLMLQVAEEVIEDYPDGVWLVELAPLTDPERITGRIAAVLSIEEQPARPLLDTLTNHLRRKALLLLLDNVEHLVLASAELAEALLLNCSSIKILVTGREALAIDGETTLQIPSLTLPEDLQSPDDFSRLERSEAVQLFLARARSVRPDFALTSDNAPALVEVVRRLDGIPLALELAAARLRMMSVGQIAAHLNDRFRLLTGGRRTALPRQQTLQALIDWSWNLLDEGEHILLRRLSVFTGGWTLEAAQTITSDAQLDEFEVLDLLDQLINKSLITVHHLSGGVVRYNMLESIHQYARARLFEAGEGEQLRDRHAEYYTDFSEQVSQALQGPDMLDWLDRLLAETDNAKATREWALETRLDLALRMASASILVTRYWFFTSADIRWLEQVVQRARALPEAERMPEYPQELAKAIISLGATISLFGDFEKGRQILEEGIHLAQDAGVVAQRVFGLNILLISLYHMSELSAALDIAEKSLALSRQQDLKFWRLTTLSYLIAIFVMRGDQAQADAYAEETVRLARELDNPWLNALIFFHRARIENLRENWNEAEKCAEEAADLFEAIRDYGLALAARSELGHMRRMKGDFSGAAQIYRRTIVAFQERGHRSAVAHQLECMGYIATHMGDNALAARLLGAAQALRVAIQIHRLPPEQVTFDQALVQLGEGMGAAARDKEMAAGGRLNMDEAITLALQDGSGF